MPVQKGSIILVVLVDATGAVFQKNGTWIKGKTGYETGRRFPRAFYNMQMLLHDDRITTLAVKAQEVVKQNGVWVAKDKCYLKR